MKRKSRSDDQSNLNEKPLAAAEAPVDSGVSSDADTSSDVEPLIFVRNKGTWVLSNRKSGQCQDSGKAVANNVTSGSASAELARDLSSSHTNAIEAPSLQQQTTGGKEPKSSQPAVLNNEDELVAAEKVIKKIMKMGAAKEFNSPVDSVALRIPDYHDIIKTPMDFGTICSSLERGLQYRNSEDVYKDVQLIFENCAEYNMKGSYILERMKRVKANFMRQWRAAGLYKEQQTVGNNVNIPPAFRDPADLPIYNPPTYQTAVAPPPPLYQNPSTSHAPAPQLNQSGYQQLQASHVEGGMNIEHSGNLTMPPLGESTVNGKTEGGTKRPRRQPDKINSTRGQSSSMNNMEARDVSEHSEYNDQESNSMADRDISKRRRPTKRISGVGSRIMKRKHREQCKCMSEVARIKVNTDVHGDPIGPESRKLASFLGTLARNGDYLPLNYPDWRAVPKEVKESIWGKVQVAFDIDPRSKARVIHRVSLRWRNWKSFLKTSRYDRHETDEERLADRDNRVSPEQWAALVEMWGTEAAKKRSETNKANRAKMIHLHTTGSMSFARIREEQKVKSDGKDLTREELFILTRTRKDGTTINAETSEVIAKLKEREQHQQGTPGGNGEKPYDILTEIIGPRKRGGSRCAGTSMPDPVRPPVDEAIRMPTQDDTEIHEMKRKMAFTEQTCAEMASQMATMMSSMNLNLANEGDMPDDKVPETGATSNQSTIPDPTPQVPAATSGNSDQPTPQQENIMSHPPLDTMPQIPVTPGTSDPSVPQQENTTSSI